MTKKSSERSWRGPEERGRRPEVSAVFASINKNCYRKRVFMSYSSADRSFAKWLSDSLTAAGLSVWIDYLEINVGDSIVDKVGDGLGQSDALIVILSNSSVKSRWVREELNSAVIRMLDGTDLQILPVLMEKCDIPILIRNRRYADFTADKNSALRELMEAIIPQGHLWSYLDRLLNAFRLTVKDARLEDDVPNNFVKHSMSKEETTLSTRTSQLLVDLEFLLSAALLIRYQIEARIDWPKIPPDRLHLYRDFGVPDLEGFGLKFEYLELRGLKLKSRAWASLRDFRNSLLHSNPDYGIDCSLVTRDVELCAREAMSRLDELTDKMESLCSK